MNDIYTGAIDDFLKDNPEIDPSLKDLIEPLFRETDHAIFIYFMNAFL